jgi:hypothetical protein
VWEGKAGDYNLKRLTRQSAPAGGARRAALGRRPESAAIKKRAKNNEFPCAARNTVQKYSLFT